jgi:lipid II:glycine glycyltransferase (peptidoglycan interpeptide bridge formation enzyme)
VTLPELLEQLKPSSNGTLTYWSVPQIDGDDYSFMGDKTKYETPIIDLALSLDDIMDKCISRKRRQTIRSASRKGVVIEKLELQNLDICIEQCNHLKESVGLKPRPTAFFTRLFEFYNSRKRMSAFAAKVGKSDLASGVVIGNKTMIHLWIAGKPRGTIPKGVPRQDLLIWETIKWAKQSGSRYYDLCYVDAVRQRDIAIHKLGFSRNVVPFYCISRKSISARFLSRLQKTRTR